MNTEKTQSDGSSTASRKEEARIEHYNQDDKISVGSLESQSPKLKRTLKARHLAVSYIRH
jgi:lysine-specific permease